MAWGLPPEQGGATEEPPPRKPYLSFVRPVWEQPIRGVSVNSRLSMAWSHWDGERRVRCPGAPACQLCVKYGFQRIWSGYLLLRMSLTPQERYDLTHGVGRKPTQTAIAEITWGANQHRTWKTPPPKDWSWRGMGVILARMSDSRQAAVSLQLFPACKLDGELPPEYDISAHLLARWPLAPVAGEQRPTHEK